MNLPSTPLPDNPAPDAISQSARRRAVIFDFGGVLMKTTDYSPRYRWDDRLNLPHGSVERILHSSASWRKTQMGLLPPADYWLDIAHRLRLTLEETTRLEQDFYSGDELDNELVDYIRQLRMKRHPVALLSNDSPALFEKLKSLTIADLFNPLVISANIGMMKPDPSAFQYVLEALNRPANETILVDDMPANIAGASALGIHGIQYTTLPALRTALEPLLMF
jgi:putative hydrolase of the HAD superfamily